MPELVALQLPGGPDFVDAVRRIWGAGDAVLPLPPRAPKQHLAALLDATRPARLIDEHGDHVTLEGGIDTLEGDAVVIATSGTTGTPKGVVHTHDGVRAAGYASTIATGVGADVSWLACLPLWHVGGFSVVTRALVAGLGLEVHDGFDAARVEAASHTGSTHVSLVPTALARIDPSRWERILLGGSAIPADRPSNCIATYGMTETMGGVVYDGLALPGYSMRIVDPAATDLDAPAGTLGPIELRGPSLLRAYRVTSPDLSGPAGVDPVSADGWFRTGDLGSIDRNGALSVHGRADDVITTGAEKVWPATVEAILETDHRVAAAAVVGIPDREWGQRVVAFVVPRDPGTSLPLEALRDLVRTRLPAYCAPKEVVLADSLPRTDLGKIQRSLLVARYPELGHQ